MPFRGDRDELERLVSRLGRIRLASGDTVTVVDNTGERRRAAPPADGVVDIVPASPLRTPGFARNEGVRRGSAQWLLFLDADVDPDHDLLDRYFEPAPSEQVGLLAGGVVDQPVGPAGPAAARYAYLQEAMSQRQTFRLGEWAFAQMANAACRRIAFEAVGGFRGDIRTGEDADLCYRLRAAGWTVARRENARVVHHNRRTTRAFIAQKALHGAGAGWLDAAYPGSFPRRRRAGLVWWACRRVATGLFRAARQRKRDVALLAVFEALEQLSFEFGRSLPNDRPLRLRPPRR